MSLLKRLWEGTQTVEDDLNVWSDAGWPRHCFHDDDLDRWVDRLNGLRDLLVQRGGFSAKSATKALVNPDPKSKERTALWLSSELAKLRKTEQQVGAAPVRTGAALTRLTIADLAITMVQFLEGPPGENLICLLQELLDVDRHRKALAENPGNEFTRAAMTEAIGALQGRTYGVRELAKLVSVDPSSITRWRRSAEYQRMVEAQKKTHEDRLHHLVHEILLEKRAVTREQAFEQAIGIAQQRQDLKKYRAELVDRLTRANTFIDVRMIYERHLLHPFECGEFSPSDMNKMLNLFNARLNEIAPSPPKRAEGQ